MKAVLLLVLCFALYCSLVEAKRKSVPRYRRRGMTGKSKLQFKRLKKLMKEHRKLLGNREGPNLTGDLVETDNPARPMRRNRPLQTLKTCKARCQGLCMDSDTCQQTCNSTCAESRVFLLCQLHCKSNQCISSSCATCHKDCDTEIKECRQENCSEQCSDRPSRRGHSCKQCVTSHCLSSSADSDGDELASETLADHSSKSR